MKTITVNSQDLGDVGTIDTYQTFVGDQVDENLVDFYNEDKGTDYTPDDFEWDYDMALDMTEMIYNIFVENNTNNDIADTYFPDTEIACAIYDAIKYGKGVK